MWRGVARLIDITLGVEIAPSVWIIESLTADIRRICILICLK